MKILFLTDGIYPFRVGGMQKHSAILIRLLASRGIQLTVIHPGGKNYSDQNLKSEFETMDLVEFIHVPFPSLSKFPGHYIRENRMYSASCLKAVDRKLKEYDLIYAQGFTGLAFMKLRQKRLSTVPVILNLHGFEMFQVITGLKNKLANGLLRKEASRHLALADYVYSFGGQIDSILIEQKVPSSKILSQSNGIMDSWIGSEVKNHDTRNFIFIGRNERRKGIAELNSALKKLLENKELKFTFHFIGPLDDSEKVNAPNIFYHGEIRKSDQIKLILDNCDCLVSPSYSEGMPTVILEAMARGLAVIATRVGAVERMIADNGILLSKPEVELISDAIIKLIVMPDDELRKMKLKSLELVRDRFSWEAVVDSKIQDFRKIVSQKN